MRLALADRWRVRQAEAKARKADRVAGLIWGGAIDMREHAASRSDPVNRRYYFGLAEAYVAEARKASDIAEAAHREAKRLRAVVERGKS